MAKRNPATGKSILEGVTTSHNNATNTTHNPHSPTRPETLRDLKVEANRPVGPGGTKHRGDRRDTSKAYTNNKRVRANHSNPKGSGSHDQNPHDASGT